MINSLMMQILQVATLISHYVIGKNKLTQILLTWLKLYLERDLKIFRMIKSKG